MGCFRLDNIPKTDRCPALFLQGYIGNDISARALKWEHNTGRIFMSGQSGRAYVLVAIEPGKEQEFANEIVSKGLILNSKVERMDFVHGSFDFIVILVGRTYDIDHLIFEMRKLPFVRKTETLIPFEMLNWEDISKTFEQSR